MWFEQTLKPSERPQLVARLFKALSGLGRKAIQSESAETCASIDAEQHLEFVQPQVGILPILDLGNKLDDYVFR